MALNTHSRLRYVTFFYLYLMQGIPSGFALTAIANYLVGKHVAPQTVGTFIAIVGIPWIIQFIWGPLIDRYQYSVIGHRKQWVVLTQCMATVASLGLLYVSVPEQQIGLMTAAFFVHSLFASVQDASVDAIAISVVPVAERGRVNAFMRGGYLVGISLGAAGLSAVLHTYGFHTAVLLQTATLLVFTVCTFFTRLDEDDRLIPAFFHRNQASPKPAGKNPPAKYLFRKLFRGILRKQSLQQFGVIAGVYVCFSIFIRSYTYHIIHVLGWADQSVSVLQGSWGSLLTFVVIIGGGAVSDRIGAKKLQQKVMWGVAVFLLLLNGLSAWWGTHALTSAGLVLWNFADPLFSVASFPVLMSMCDHEVEGSQFTAYMAIINFCDVAGSYVTGWALTVFPAPAIGFTCGVVMLLLITGFRRLRTVNHIPVKQV